MAKAEDIARLWAEQAPKGATVAGNFWRDKILRTAGHYGSRLAAILDLPNEAQVAMVKINHWGTGTAMFLNLCAHHAERGGLPTFRVPHIMPKADNLEHAANLAYFEKEALACEEKIARAKTVDWQAKADAIRAEAQRYRKTFNLG